MLFRAKFPFPKNKRQTYYQSTNKLRLKIRRKRPTRECENEVRRATNEERMQVHFSEDAISLFKKEKVY